LHFDCAAHCVDHAAEFSNKSVAGALDDAPLVHGDGRVDEIAAQGPQPSQRAILVGACRLNPTTAAARIAASFRFSFIAAFSRAK
jgi:hypothetical protein